jgi:outer membrane immunogenic protein
MKIKKVLLGTIALVALHIAAPAWAADLPAKPYVKAPMPVPIPIYDWTGFYIGANGGWAQTHACVDLITPAGADLISGCRDASGGVFGGQLGYRWQTNQLVFGVEAQGDWSNINASRVSLVNSAFTTETKLQGLGLFTGQIGYAWNAALLYLKGGAAVTRNSFDILSAGVGVASLDSTRWGGTVGVGFEYGFSPNWTVGFEYDHLFMGDANNSFSVVNPIVAGALNRISENVDMVTIRFNYRFGGFGAPVAARY